jgi:DNA-binding beta-propeller fold protein YncE
MKRSIRGRFFLILPVLVCALLAGGAVRIVQDQCGPFTDVTPGFCPYVLELYYLGITVGTSATTFSPDDPLTRGQAAVFISKGLNQSLARSSRRAALGQWWTTTPHYDLGLGVTAVGPQPLLCATDGNDIWVPAFDGTVSRVRASDGALLGTWVDAIAGGGVLVAMGRVFVAGAGASGILYMIDPSQPPGAVTVVASSLGANPTGITFDGSRIWTANLGSVSIITPAAGIPWSVTTVSTGFTTLVGALYDGANVWVTDYAAGTLLKLDATGAILQTIAVGALPENPVFDGANIWVPNFRDGSVSVVHGSTGAVLTTLTGLGVNGPVSAAFDGQRVLVTNYGNSEVSVWKAADFTPLGTSSTGANTLPVGACSDGMSFWIALNGPSQLARF